MQKNIYLEGYTQNREISWLRFDDRCLMEAKDPAVPLLERMKFISIFSSNLDEFFSVRVGSLTELNQVHPDQIDNKTGWNAETQLKKIYAYSGKLCRKRETVYQDLKHKMKEAGIEDLSMSDWTEDDTVWLKKFFHSYVEPILGAQIVDTRHPLPQLQSGVVYAAGIMKWKGSQAYAMVSVPSSLPKIVQIPSMDGSVRFAHMEDVVLANMESVFRGAAIKDRFKFYVIRNADVSVDDDTFDDQFEDYRELMSDMLKKRRKMDMVRVEVSDIPSAPIRKYLFRQLKITDSMVYRSEMPLDRKYMFQIADFLPEEKKKKFLYPEYTPKLSPAFDYQQNLFDQVLKKDVLLSYPYESMDPFLLLVREAANDPKVASIKITIYRLAKRARLVDYLCLAAENGKEVDVLIELKARFDEQNNIDYSEKLQDAGCTVLYGFTDYKVHSKICLITRLKEEKPEHVVLIATGNFNENTAKSYTDLAYLTARKDLIRDAVMFFQNMMIGRLDGHYRHLLVSPVSLKSGLLNLIDEEIAKGSKGQITIKQNSITDEDLIARLQKASEAGVQVRMIVRGICCILPEVPGKTENLTVRSIVGRYLEHSRIYRFGSGRNEKMYISSADMMTRNTEHRVEIATPIMDASIRKRVDDYLDLCFRDNTKARRMTKDGKYHHVHDHMPPLNSQEEMMRLTKASDQTVPSMRPAHAAMCGKIFDTQYRPSEEEPKEKKVKKEKKKKKS